MDWLGALIVFLVAPLPIVEMRLSVYLGLFVYGDTQPTNLVITFLLTVASNLLFILALWPFLTRLERLCRRSAALDRWLDWLFARTRREVTPGKRILEEFGLFGIVALVLIPFPLPGTGLYTAMAAAYIFGLPLRKCFPWMAAGVVVATGGLILLVLAGTAIF